MNDLNVDIIYANSPGAKGRVERANRTLRDRLVVAPRLLANGFRGLRGPETPRTGGVFSRMSRPRLEYAGRKPNSPGAPRYDRETDTMVIALRDVPIKESDEVRPGVIADFGADGGVVRFEILDASKRVQDPLTVTLAMTN